MNFDFWSEGSASANYEILIWQKPVDAYCSLSIDINPIALTSKRRGIMVNLHVRSIWATQQLRSVQMSDCEQPWSRTSDAFPIIVAGASLHKLSLDSTGSIGGAPWSIERTSDGGRFEGIDRMLSVFADVGAKFFSQFVDTRSVINHLLGVQPAATGSKPAASRPSSSDALLFAILLNVAVGKVDAARDLLIEREAIVGAALQRSIELETPTHQLDRRRENARCIGAKLRSLVDNRALSQLSVAT